MMIRTRKNSEIIDQKLRGAARSECNLKYKVPKKFQ